MGIPAAAAEKKIHLSPPFPPFLPDLLTTDERKKNTHFIALVLPQSKKKEKQFVDNIPTFNFPYSQQEVSVKFEVDLAGCQLFGRRSFLLFM